MTRWRVRWLAPWAAQGQKARRAGRPDGLADPVARMSSARCGCQDPGCRGVSHRARIRAGPLVHPGYFRRDHLDEGAASPLEPTLRFKLVSWPSRSLQAMTGMPSTVPYGADQTLYLVMDALGPPDLQLQNPIERPDLDSVINDLML